MAAHPYTAGVRTRRPLRARVSDTGQLLRTEESGRADQEHRDHDEIGGQVADPAAEERQVALVAGGEGLRHADEETADEGARRGVESAEDGGGEGLERGERGGPFQAWSREDGEEERGDGGETAA